ncbi:hypothetical protein FQN52_007472 [Onygenales sp. PD_12]|nr:hypothetical protein FQN52_007472 [Onygenales sp. PD_12]
MGLMPRGLLYIDVDVKRLDPGSINALATVDCQTANLAWDVFRDTLHYYFDSEDLILQLKLKCFDFQTWARNSVLTECKLSNSLLLIYETVERTLHLTSQLFEIAGQLWGRYGLSAPCLTARRTSQIKSAVYHNNEEVNSSKWYQT